MLGFSATWHATAFWFASPVDSFIVFSPSRSVSSAVGSVLQLALFALGALVIFYVPGATLLMLRDRSPRSPHAQLGLRRGGPYEEVLACFLLSVCITIPLFAVVKATGLGPTLSRAWWLNAGATIGAVLVLFGLQRLPVGRWSCGTRAPEWKLILATVLTICLAVYLLRHQLTFSNFSDDEQEAVEFARSLNVRAYPDWLITGENGEGWGFYAVFVLFAYPVHFLTVLLGESEFTVRGFYWVSLFIDVVACAALYRLLGRRDLRWPQIALLMVAVVVSAIVAVFYSSWHPFIAGLAEPSGVDLYAFALFVSSAYWYFSGQGTLFLTASFALHLALPNGTALTCTLLALVFALCAAERRRTARLAAIYLGGVVLYHAAYPLLVSGGDLSPSNQFAATQMGRYFTRIGDWPDAVVFLRMMVMLSAGAIVVMLGNLRADVDARIRVLTLLALMQIAFAFLFEELRHIHYHLASLLLLSSLSLFAIDRAAPRSRALLTTSMLLLGLGTSAYLWPRSIQPETNARALGAATRLACPTSSLAELYRNSWFLEKIVTRLNEGITAHNWIYYAGQQPKTSEVLLLVENTVETPANFHEQYRGPKCKLLVRDGFDPRNYAAHSSYRDEPGWKLLAVRRWREFR